MVHSPASMPPPNPPDPNTSDASESVAAISDPAGPDRCTSDTPLPDLAFADFFERCRPRLLSVAYRMVGSVSDAEDIVQDAFLRMGSVELGAIADPEAYLVRVVSRLCLDSLKSARARRESYVGPWLPEPLLNGAPAEFGWHAAPVRESAETFHALRDDVSMALLVALESLSPLERAAFLLHDVFDLDFAAIAEVLERGEEACRALAARGRKHVRARRPRFPSTEQGAQRLVAAFWRSIEAGDVQALSEILTADAKLIPDGGGRVVAATRIVRGRERVARFLVGSNRRVRSAMDVSVELVAVGGLPALLIRLDGKISQISAFEFDGDRIASVFAVRNPDKLKHLGAVVPARGSRR